MQLSFAAIVAIVAAAQAENIAVVLNSDINAHLNEYLSIIQTQTGAEASQLLALYEAGQTYSDDSYTTLIDSAEYSSLSAFATQLPWYSSRLESLLTAGDAAAVSTSSAAPSTSATASSVSETSSASASASASSSETSAETSSETSSVEITSKTHSTTHTKSETSSTSESTSHSTAGANALVPGAFAGAFIAAFALL